jgi:hypothetical protein
MRAAYITEFSKSLENLRIKTVPDPVATKRGGKGQDIGCVDKSERCEKHPRENGRHDFSTHTWEGFCRHRGRGANQFVRHARAETWGSPVTGAMPNSS